MFSEWQIVNLKSVAKIERDGINPSDIVSGTAYVGLENIESGGAFVNVRDVESGELASNKFLFTEQHVLYGKLRPYLAKIARPEFRGICSTDILPILPGENLDRDYLTHFLRQPSMIDLATARSTGANLPRLSPKVLAEFQVPLPPIATQKKIAAILDQAEALRSLRRQSIEQLDALARSVFLEMFGDPVTNLKEWETFHLKDLLVDGLQNGLYKPSSKYGKGTPILRIDAFYDGQVTKINDLKRVEVTTAEQELYRLQENDIVINRVNSIEYLGKSALIPKLKEPTIFESNMMRFRLNLTRINPRFLIDYMQTSFIKAQIKVGAKDAVNQSSINQQDVNGFQIRVPPLTLQQQFADRIQAIETLKTHHRQSLATMDTLFNSLQHRAFRGEL
jgi:type I restriction enzyme, S subunit